MNIVYTITVEGGKNYCGSNCHKKCENGCGRFGEKISFDIVEDKEGKRIVYEVYCGFRLMKFLCNEFFSKIEAMRYINEAMKLAMKDEFIYQHCYSCSNDFFFPRMACGCGFIPSFSEYYFVSVDVKSDFRKEIFLPTLGLFKID